MKKHFYILLIIAVPVFSAIPSFSFAQQNSISNQQMEVMMKTASLKNALLNKDSVALSNLISDEVSYGHTNGIIQTKKELIRAIMSGEQTYKSIVPSDIKARLYDNTGIVTLKAAVSMIYQNKPLDMGMNILFVWIRKNNQWMLVARQSVKL